SARGRRPTPCRWPSWSWSTASPSPAARRRHHAAIDRLRSVPWLRVARVLFALYLVGALVSVWLPGDWRQADVALYRSDALAFWGPLSHRSPPHESPPLAVIPFALAIIGPPSVGQDCFALGMAALFVLGFFAIRRWKGASRAWTYGAYALAPGDAPLPLRHPPRPDGARLPLAARTAPLRSRLPADRAGDAGQALPAGAAPRDRDRPRPGRPEHGRMGRH